MRLGMSLVLYPGKTYHTGSIRNGRYDIKEVEVFQVSGSSLQGRIIEQVTRFVANINQAINANQACLLQAETEIFQLEERFNDEEIFIEKFATGEAKDVIVLDVLGTTTMVTTRSTLCIADACMLAKQFDDTKCVRPRFISKIRKILYVRYRRIFPEYVA